MIRRIRHTSNQSFMRFSTQQIRSTEILMGDFSFYVSPKQKLLINWKTAQSIANWKHFLFQSTGKKLLDSQIYCAQKIWKFAFTLDNSDALQSAVYSFAISTETVLNRSRKIVWKLHLLFVTSLIQFWPRFIRVSVHSIFVHLSLALKFVSPFFSLSLLLHSDKTSTIIVLGVLKTHIYELPWFSNHTTHVQFGRATLIRFIPEKWLRFFSNIFMKHKIRSYFTFRTLKNREKEKPSFSGSSPYWYRNCTEFKVKLVHNKYSSNHVRAVNGGAKFLFVMHTNMDVRECVCVWGSMYWCKR